MKKIILFVAIIIIGFAFYWYQLRPSQIVKTCNQNAITLNLADMKIQSDLNNQNGTTVDSVAAQKQYEDGYRLRYQQCLRENGLGM